MGRFLHRRRAQWQRLAPVAVLVLVSGAAWHQSTQQLASSSTVAAVTRGSSTGGSQSNAERKEAAGAAEPGQLGMRSAETSTPSGASTSGGGGGGSGGSSSTVSSSRTAAAGQTADSKPGVHEASEKQSSTQPKMREAQPSVVSSSSTSASSSTSSSKSASSSNASGSSSSSSPKPSDKPLLFYDVGHAYHHLPSCPPGWAVPGFGCDHPRCPVLWEWTTDRDIAHAVIFNTLDGMAGFTSASQEAKPGQWLVLFAMESGQYYPSIYTAKKDHGFNISADYRLDGSDVPVTYYTKWELPNIGATPVPFAKKRKDGLIAVFISNCGAKNNRGQVLEQLIKLLPGQVHSYGRCQHNKEPEPTKSSNPREEKTEIFSSYKFAFTPENSNDEGYATEKVYQALEAGTVPIYIGAPNIERLIPDPNAVVQVDKFKSVEELAQYIKKAAEDEQLYSKHLAWKQKPEAEWSEDWQALKRLTQYSAYCRIAMHVAGRPHKWRKGEVRR